MIGKQVVVWLIVMIPRPDCAKVDHEKNFVKYVNPSNNAPMEMRVGGSDGICEGGSLIRFSDKEPEIYSDDYAEVFVAELRPKFAPRGKKPAPAPAKAATPPPAPAAAPPAPAAKPTAPSQSVPQQGHGPAVR
jgi:hypothetical protein